MLLTRRERERLLAFEKEHPDWNAEKITKEFCLKRIKEMVNEFDDDGLENVYIFMVANCKEYA